MAACASARLPVGIIVLGGGVLLSLLSWLAPGFDVAYGSAGMHVDLGGDHGDGLPARR